MQSAHTSLSYTHTTAVGTAVPTHRDKTALTAVVQQYSSNPRPLEALSPVRSVPAVFYLGLTSMPDSVPFGYGTNKQCTRPSPGLQTRGVVPKMSLNG